MKKIGLILCCCLFASTASIASTWPIWQQIITPAQKQPGRWSVMLYHGYTATQNLGRILFHQQFDGAGESLTSAELAYAINPNNPIMCFASPLLDQLQLAGNFAIRHDYADPDNQVIPEADVYVMARRVNRLWQKYLYTTMAFGAGLSYTFGVPYVEEGITADSSTQFLTFLAFEFTISLPKYPQFQIVARIHHRSGDFGLFYPLSQNPGSNNIGLGIRYYFK